MVALQKAFRTAEIAQQPLSEEKKWEPIAEGWYDAMIVNADVRDTKAGTGQYIAIRFDVTEQYGDRNEIRGYRESKLKPSMVKAGAAVPPWAAKPAEGLDDDIPF